MQVNTVSHSNNILSKKRSREALSLDQRKIIYQNWKKGKIVEEIVVDLQKIYGEMAPSRRTVYYWVKRFDEGDEQIEDHKRSGRPRKLPEDAILLIIRTLKKNPSLSIRSISDTTGLSHGTIQRILSEKLNIKKIDDIWELPSDNTLHEMGYFMEKGPIQNSPAKSKQDNFLNEEIENFDGPNQNVSFSNNLLDQLISSLISSAASSLQEVPIKQDSSSTSMDAVQNIDNLKKTLRNFRMHKYRPEYETMYPGIMPSTKGDEYFYCIKCKRHFMLSARGPSEIRRHLAFDRQKIKQVKSMESKEPKKKQQFKMYRYRDHYGEMFPGIQRSSYGERYYYCLVCDKHLTLRANGIRAIRDHIKISKHRISLKKMGDINVCVEKSNKAIYTAQKYQWIIVWNGWKNDKNALEIHTELKNSFGSIAISLANVIDIMKNLDEDATQIIERELGLCTNSKINDSDRQVKSDQECKKSSLLNEKSLTKNVEKNSITKMGMDIEENSEEVAKTWLHHLQMIQQALFLNKEDNFGINIKSE